jgi:hypothetical protein
MTTKARLARLEKNADRLARDDRRSSVVELSKYRNDPVGYAREVLGVTPTPDQIRVAESLLRPPYRTLVKSGHSIGKTFMSAWFVNWWYDTRNPGITISTAPTHRDVVDLLWTEVRLQRWRAKLPDHFIGPAAPEMRSGEEHYAKGFTAGAGESFQGRHRPHQLFVFEEAEGIPGIFWTTTDTMFQPDGTNCWLAILNPTTTTSQSYQEEMAVDVNGQPKWNVFSISSLNHPNISEQLAGRPAIIPTAVTLEQVHQWLGSWFEPIPTDEVDAERDVEFPPASNRWYRPGPEGEARVLGRRPTAGTFGVWSERLWALATRPTDREPWLTGSLPEIGCDVARYGFDKTAIHVQCGGVSLHHEEHGGWGTVETANRLNVLAEEWAAWSTRHRPATSAPVSKREIRIKVDDTGVGGGVTDLCVSWGDLDVIPVNAGAGCAIELYPRVRDALWFLTREKARSGELSAARLPANVRRMLEVQALAPTWKPTPDRKRQVESKEDTAKRLKRSPDGMDAFNLSHY